MSRSLPAIMWIVVVACGIPLDAQPETFTVVVGDPPVVESPAPADLVAVPFYLVEEDGVIAAVTRDLPPPPGIASIVESLLDGTTEPEEGTGLRTSIPSGTRLLGVEREGSTAYLDLSRDFAAVGGEEELLAVAQIVLTVTELDGVEAVAFELEGVPTDVPLPNGALSDRPVAARQYRMLLHR